MMTMKITTGKVWHDMLPLRPAWCAGGCRTAYGVVVYECLYWRIQMKGFKFTPFEAVLTVIVFLLLVLLTIVLYPVITLVIGGV